MATSVTISPTTGHPVLPTQGGIGSTPGYDAIDLRRMIEAGSAGQEGVFNATGWKVTQDTGSNLKVQVAANVGLAVVQGDSITFQSRYVIAPHSAVATLDIGSNASGNPRIDQVVLQVRDNTHDGSGQNDARTLVLAGTATSGATLDNRTGAAALPSGAIRLADILVANGATAITNAVVRDRRPWARGAFFKTTRNNSNADYVVTATGMTVLDATNLAPRIECSGTPVRVTLTGVHASPSTGNGNIMLAVDGTAIDADVHSTVTLASSSLSVPFHLSRIAVPSAGSHIIAPYALSTAGAGFRIKADNSQFLSLTIEEIVRPNSSN